MARTFRRKGVEYTFNRSGHNAGFKTNGHYTTWDRSVSNGNGHEGVRLYREMTELEVWHANRSFHGESSNNNAWGPGKYYKVNYQLMLNQHNATQLRKYLNGLGEYDPVFMDNLPKSSLDWRMW